MLKCFSLLLFVSLSFAAPALANPIAVSCEQAANTLNVPFDAEVDVACPANCGFGAVWGTEFYSDDSSICTAAVHDGRLAAGEAGTVRIRIEGARTSYAASTRNGVTTMEWGEWPRTFRFVGGARQIDCSTTAQTLELGFGQTMTLICPPLCGTIGTVWGTDIYSDDSAVCQAAIHAGAITSADGGTFLLRIHDGQQSYTGSMRNGVTTSDWGAWQRSFSVSR